MKRTTTHALIGATTLGLVVPALVAGLSTAATAARVSYTQDADMTILDPGGPSESNYDGLAVPSVGAATPYPSTIEMQGGGQVADVNVWIDVQSHDNAEDLDLLLVGPGGQQATILSDAGGPNPLSWTTLYLDDEADAPLAADPILPDSYVNAQPTNLEGVDEFPAPAPAATGASVLSVFDGTPVRGTWSLYVVDDAGDLAPSEQAIAGWGLSFEVSGSRVDPYPSTITVADALPVIKDVDVTLHGLTHTWTRDLDVLLVGPGGQQVTLASDSGGGGDVTDLTFTLDDEADQALTDSDTWGAGSFRPANFGDLEDAYPAPAPAATGDTLLSVFDGTDPNGTWRLFVTDDAGGDEGILSGWSLSIDAVDPHKPIGLMSIEGGAERTGSATVDLDLRATDPAPGTGVAQMRFSNDGTTWSPWQAYARSASWELTAGNGTKTVWAQFVDRGGNVSEAVSDTITLALDLVSPSAKKVRPEVGTTGVGLGVHPKVRAGEKLAGSSVTKRSVLLKEKGAGKRVKASRVKGTVDYKAGRRQIVFKPKGDLKPSTKYVFIVKTSVTDKAGNAFDGDPKKPGAQALRIKFKTR